MIIKTAARTTITTTITIAAMAPELKELEELADGESVGCILMIMHSQ
jgi:hypothetical protein